MMKKLIFGILVAGTCSVGQAQVPDSTRKIKPSMQHPTDSVRNNKEVYNGNKTTKNKSNGDTLAAPDTRKTGTKNKGTNPK